MSPPHLVFHFCMFNKNFQQPKLEIKKFEDGKDVIAQFLVELMPDFKIPDLANLKITKPVVSVTEILIKDFKIQFPEKSGVFFV